VTPKLLLADDSVTIQRVIELTFADEDVQVLAVGDGRQAIERVKADRPDIVLADVGMPERDGYDVAAFIKGDPQLAHIPVLLLTGAFEPIDEVKARAVGCDGVLVKPFEPQMVISRVRDLLAGRRSAAPLERPVLAPSRPVPIATRTERLDPHPAVPLEATAGSLEDYFDRLDAALAGKAAPAPTPVAAPAPLPAPTIAASPSPPAPSVGAAPAVTVSPAAGDPHADLDSARRDPVTAGEPVRPAPISVPLEAVPPPAPPASADAWQPPPLPEAFAALLAAEQGRVIAPPIPPVDPHSNEFLDELARRVIARMGDDAMRTAVLDAAERLVREEITRIKSQK